MWAYRSGEDSDEPIVLLDYQPGRGQIHPQTLLGDYRGILMSDGCSAWRTLEGAIHLGCMAHSRRRFVNALKTRNKPGGPPEQAPFVPLQWCSSAVAKPLAARPQQPRSERAAERWSSMFLR